MCRWGGTSVLCAGSVTIEGLGMKLETVVTFECSLVCLRAKPGPACSRPGSGRRSTPSTLKTEPDQIERGVTFPVIVAPAPK
jgi:hypothetical protein